MDENLKNALNCSKSLSDLARCLFGKENYTNREKCKKLLESEGIDWKSWLDEKRTNNKRFCLYCGKEITGDSRKKFCNHSCSASYNNKGVIRNKTGANGHKNIKEDKCVLCGKELTKTQKKFCSKECEIEYKYQEKIKQWKNGSSKGCDASGGMSNYLRKYFLEKANYSCEQCGFNKNNEYTGLSILQLHHKDGDCYNNSEDNIEVLCPNCHCLTENFGSRNKNSTRVDRRTKYYRESIIPKASAQCQ